MSDVDPRCPECGEPIGQTATYCMHCSADLTAERAAADADDDGAWDSSAPGGSTDTAGAGEAWGWGASGETTHGAAERAGESATEATASPVDGQILDPDGPVDDTLTAAVGILGGIVVGVVALVVTPVVTGSGWGILLGIVAWLGSTAYLVRQRTVQGALAKGGYALAVVLLSIPTVAFSPVADVEGGLTARAEFFAASLFVVAFPAGFAAALGWIASRFVPEDASEIPT